MLPLDLSSPMEDTAHEPRDRQLAILRDALIDLMPGNPLLSLPANGREHLALPGVAPDALIASLTGRRSLLIAPETSGLDVFESSPARPRRTTLSLPADDFRCLERLHRHARSVVQEKGVQSLFAALGVLEWPDPQSPGVLVRSPLLLVAVTLERVSGVHLLRLRRFDTEILFNPILRAAWERFEIDLNLPFVTDDAPFDPVAFLQAVQSAAASRADWSVAVECLVGSFAPHELAMASDLETLAVSVQEHPLAAALLGDSDALRRYPAVALPAPNELDAAPERLHCVLDADPAQRRAILAARRGQSFVLHGPPGTGKSQTIANLMADGIAEGKRVLFVAQKTAALDAVFTRLRDRGLASFCLEAHGDNASKKPILDQLRAALEARPAEGIPVETDRQELDRLTGQLNQTVAALHAPRLPLGLSVHEANGLVAGVLDAPDLPFVFAAPETVTPSEYRALEERAAQLADYRDLLGELTTHPWRGVLIEKFDLDLQRQIESSLTASLNALKALTQGAALLARGWHLDAPQSVHETDVLAEIAAVARETPHPPSSWLTLTGEERAILRAEAEALRARQATRRAALDLLREDYDDALFALPLSDLEQRLGDRHEAALQPVFGREWRDKIALESNILEEILGRIGERIVGVQQTMSPIADALDRPSANTILELADLLGATAQAAPASLPSSLLEQGRAAFAALGESLRALGPFLEMPRLPFTDRSLPQAHLPDLAAWVAAVRASVSDYGDAYRTVIDARRDSRPLPSFHQLAADLARAAALQRADEAEAQTQAAWYTRYGAFAQGAETDWDHVLSALAWTERLCACFPDAPVPADFAMFVCNAPSEALRDLVDRETRVRLDREALRHAFAPLQDLFPPERLHLQGHALETLRYEAFSAWLTVRLERLSDLERWLGLQSLRGDCERLGLLSFFEAATHHRIAPDTLVPAFRKRFHRLWLDAVLERDPILKAFRGEEQNARIARFAERDARRVDGASEEVRALGQARRPTALFSVGEAALLRAQFHRRQQTSIRSLLGQIPNLLACLKPCLVMSPASVSQFLDLERIGFDLVIFDEASHLPVRDALGALLRARQVIVVGDRHQHAPNPGVLSAGEAGASILEAADALASEESPHFARHALTWHYRSCDESLIAVSRRQFYPNLKTFPAAREEQAVVFEHVPSGISYGGSARGDNPIEAAHVAALVSQWARREPRRSLGVITFSAAQQEAVEQAVARRVRAEPDLESLLDEGGPEGFFVKNCDYAQGDERDVILLSVGYGLGPDVPAAHRFGALDEDGGEALLNVAITRARRFCVVVTSLLPGEIASERLGSRLLREYLEQALSGRLAVDVPSTLGSFEQAIETALTARGHHVRRRIGISENTIALAVVDPNDPSRYLLGIECDGAAYLDVPTASMRDRCRGQVLNTLGWRLVRVWSSDWVRSPEAEVARIEALLLAPNDPPPASPPVTVPPDLAPYERANFTLAGGFPALDDEDAREEFLCSVVGLEGPLAMDAAAQRLARSAGLARADDRTHAILEDTVEGMVEKGILEQRGSFLWTRGARPPARVPRAGEPPRSVEHVASEEIGEIALAALRASSGMRRAALVLETARLLGHLSADAKARERIEEALSLLEREHRVHVRGSLLRVSKG